MASPPQSTEKQRQGQHEEQVERLATYDRNFSASNITEAHRNYLIERHGTFELDPVPDFTDADPLNWSLAQVSRCSKGC